MATKSWFSPSPSMHGTAAAIAMVYFFAALFLRDRRCLSCRAEAAFRGRVFRQRSLYVCMLHLGGEPFFIVGSQLLSSRSRHCWFLAVPVVVPVCAKTLHALWFLVLDLGLDSRCSFDCWVSPFLPFCTATLTPKLSACVVLHLTLLRDLWKVGGWFLLGQLVRCHFPRRSRCI